MNYTVHNAKKCTHGGVDLWIAALCDGRGKFTCRMKDVEAFDTESEAVTWAEAEIRRRGYAEATRWGS